MSELEATTGLRAQAAELNIKLATMRLVAIRTGVDGMVLLLSTTMAAAIFRDKYRIPIPTLIIRREHKGREPAYVTVG